MHEAQTKRKETAFSWNHIEFDTRQIVVQACKRLNFMKISSCTESKSEWPSSCELPNTVRQNPCKRLARSKKRPLLIEINTCDEPGDEIEYYQEILSFFKSNRNVYKLAPLLTQRGDAVFLDMVVAVAIPAMYRTGSGDGARISIQLVLPPEKETH